jgi:hypothetical protein
VPGGIARHGIETGDLRGTFNGAKVDRPRRTPQLYSMAVRADHPARLHQAREPLRPRRVGSGRGVAPRATVCPAAGSLLTDGMKGTCVPTGDELSEDAAVRSFGCERTAWASVTDSVTGRDDGATPRPWVSQRCSRR